ncbi:hypothetical protein PR202_gb14142 [Eleusine coracana subsp. coracana]|uniref:Uncharacterized protein n=1 Tax=Eleusine coracana subsp. coracana TaxID=191504 RepID=A0AAV5EUZ9_ELECO|nr:hypothetical protein PR202_gb14142 [Eleusine coracana subsp. coracana]
MPPPHGWGATTTTWPYPPSPAAAATATAAAASSLFPPYVTTQAPTWNGFHSLARPT